MTWTADLLARIQAPAAPLLTATHAPVAVRRLAAALDDAPDLIAAGQVATSLILEVEAAADALAVTAKQLRQALAEVMAESGAPSFRTDTHLATVSDGRAGVLITDPALIPADLMRQPPPAPDKAAIAKLLKEGRPVPGATLGNGGPQLTIRARI